MRLEPWLWREILKNFTTGALIFMLIFAFATDDYGKTLGIPTPVVALACASAAILVTFSEVLSHRDRQRDADTQGRVREAEDALEAALRRSEEMSQGEDLPGQIALGLPDLWAVTHRRLDHYHGIALGQAERSFRNAQIAMVTGFLMLAGFVAVALNAGTATGSVVAGGLGAVSAALAGYVSRTFVRSQESAAGHLRAYFEQPLEFSRYLAAERLVADSNLSDEQRAEVVTALAQAMIAGPHSPAAPDTGNSPNGVGGGAA
jgi:hypothetical protein